MREKERSSSSSSLSRLVVVLSECTPALRTFRAVDPDEGNVSSLAASPTHPAFANPVIEFAGGSERRRRWGNYLSSLNRHRQSSNSPKLDSSSRTPAGGSPAKRPGSPPDAPQPSSRRARFDLPAFTDLADNHSTRSNSPEPLMTPTLSESYRGLRQNLSFKSLRELEVRELQAAVWRKGGRGEPGEERYRPKNLDELLVHAARGGAREFLRGGGGGCGEWS